MRCALFYSNGAEMLSKWIECWNRAWLIGTLSLIASIIPVKTFVPKCTPKRLSNNVDIVYKVLTVSNISPGSSRPAFVFGAA